MPLKIPTVTIPEAFQIAQQHHQAGRLAEAEALYRQIVAVEPRHADALHLLGVLAHQAGRGDLAVDLIRQAIAVAPQVPGYHYNLGLVLTAQGRLDEAIAACRRALELRPDYAEAHNNLGNALRGQGRLDEAVAAYRRALQLQPDYAEAWHNLGVVLTDQGQLDEAIATYRRALELQPDLAEAHNHLGNALKAGGRLDEALAAYRRALQLQPDYAEAHYNLGNALLDQGQFDEALAACRRALQLQPDYAEAHYNLGNAHLGKGQLDEAMAAYRRVLQLKPDFAKARNNLGTVLKDQGQLDQALAAIRRAIQLRPDDAGTHSNLVYTALFHPGYDDQRIADEHRLWNRQFADPLKPFLLPHANARDPERRLRIGYVSPDFRDHVVGRNMLPLLEHHDRRDFEILCYSGVVQPDALTGRFRQRADHWRNTVRVADAELAELIRQDRVDILVDLTQHMAGNRLPVFARRPAPVQVSFAGYPASAGLDTIDCRLTDPWLDPPETPSHHYPEKPIRLPHSFWCYDPLTGSPPVNPLPALAAGHVTFGSLNNYCKVHEGVIGLWAKVLGAVPDSRFLLLSPLGAHRQRAVDVFARSGVTAGRIEWFTPAPRPEYLAAYHRIDLGLDTFPYNGHTTSLDSFWMGVPVITLVGKTTVGRGGLSQAMNLGLPELVAQTPGQYVQRAVAFATDLPRLAGLRQSLRPRMQASPLMDAPQFARDIEAACRTMWRAWCAK